MFPYTEGFDSLGAAGAFPSGQDLLFIVHIQKQQQQYIVLFGNHSAVRQRNNPSMGEDINTKSNGQWRITSSGTIEGWSNVRSK